MCLVILLPTYLHSVCACVRACVCVCVKVKKRTIMAEACRLVSRGSGKGEEGGGGNRAFTEMAEYRKYCGNAIFRYLIPRCDLDLDLECSTPIFRITLWLLIMYHRSMFGYKRSSNSQIIVRTNIKRTFIQTPNFRRDLDLEHSSPPFFHKTLKLMIMYQQTKFSCKKYQHFKKCVRNRRVFAKFLCLFKHFVFYVSRP